MVEPPSCDWIRAAMDATEAGPSATPACKAAERPMVTAMPVLAAVLLPLPTTSLVRPAFDQPVLARAALPLFRATVRPRFALPVLVAVVPATVLAAKPRTPEASLLPATLTF